MAVDQTGGRGRALLRAATIGFASGTGNMVLALAIAALLFAGPLSPGLGVGIGVMLVGSTILTLVIALRSTLPNSIGAPQESAVAILAMAIMAATAGIAGPPEVKVATAVAVLGTSSVVTGILFWTTGRLKLGRLVRFMPYPVVAGFLAGSGWLLIDGSVVMMTGEHIGPSLIDRIDRATLAFLIAPAIAFAVILKFSIERFRTPFVLAIVMAASALAFFAALAAAGLSMEEARALGYFPPLTDHGGIELPTLKMLGLVDWEAVLSVAPTIIAVAVISMIGLLLNLGGLELAVRRDIDINAELKSSGLANFLSGLIGGPVGFVALAFTILAERTGVHGRSAGIATGIAMILGLIVAGSFVFDIPVFLAAGFIFFIGLDMMLDWLVATRRKLPASEWMIVVFILACVIFIGFMEGLAAGVLVSQVLFVFTYARLPVIRMRATGSEYRSSVDRSAAATRFLGTKGDAIEVVQLQGYLFFGSADGLVNHVQRRLADSDLLPLRFLILDFRHLTGLDSAATSSFVKIGRVCGDNGVGIFFTRVSEEIRNVLELAGLEFGDNRTMAFETDMDHALEHAEEALLEHHGNEEETGVLDYFNALAGPHPRMGDLIDRMTKIEAKLGDRIITAGERSDDLFFIARGRVCVQMTLPDGRTLRLRTMSASVFVGEIGLYMRQERTADVLVDAPSEIFRLCADDLARLEAGDPELALLAHRLLAVNLCEKLSTANQAIKRAER